MVLAVYCCIFAFLARWGYLPLEYWHGSRGARSGYTLATLSGRRRKSVGLQGSATWLISHVKHVIRACMIHSEPKTKGPLTKVKIRCH